MTDLKNKLIRTGLIATTIATVFFGTGYCAKQCSNNLQNMNNSVQQTYIQNSLDQERYY